MTYTAVPYRSAPSTEVADVHQRVDEIADDAAEQGGRQQPQGRWSLQAGEDERGHHEQQDARRRLREAEQDRGGDRRGGARKHRLDEHHPAQDPAAQPDDERVADDAIGDPIAPAAQHDADRADDTDRSHRARTAPGGRLRRRARPTTSDWRRDSRHRRGRRGQRNRVRTAWSARRTTIETTSCTIATTYRTSPNPGPSTTDAPPRAIPSAVKYRLGRVPRDAMLAEPSNTARGDVTTKSVNAAGTVFGVRVLFLKRGQARGCASFPATSRFRSI